MRNKRTPDNKSLLLMESQKNKQTYLTTAFTLKPRLTDELKKS